VSTIKGSPSTTQTQRPQTPQSTQTTQTKQTADAQGASDAQGATSSSPPDSGPGRQFDGFDSDGPVTSSQSIRNLQASAPKGDAALADQARAIQAQQHAGGVHQRRTEEPRVADGPAAAGEAGNASAAQTAFVQEMQGRGVQASQPPTPEQLRQYFGTYNNRADRPEALQAYQRYSDAYHVHAAEAGRGNADVPYSRETHYALNGDGRHLYNTRAEAEAAAQPLLDRGRDVTIDEMPTRDASSWNDVLRSDKHDGRHVNDCEGFAYTAQDLLGAAGYRSEQVSLASRDEATDHAVTVLRDPSRPRDVHVASNGDVTSGRAGGAGERNLINAAYTAAGGEGTPTHYRGATQAEAQARMQLARSYAE